MTEYDFTFDTIYYRVGFKQLDRRLDNNWALRYEYHTNFDEYIKAYICHITCEKYTDDPGVSGQIINETLKSGCALCQTQVPENIKTMLIIAGFHKEQTCLSKSVFENK